MAVRTRTALVAHHCFGDLIADSVDRIERGHRLLEHHRNLGAAHLRERGLAEREHVAPADPNATGQHRTPARQQPHQRPHGHGLARTGFADQAQDLAGHEPE